jgi:hypothetical protein
LFMLGLSVAVVFRSSICALDSKGGTLADQSSCPVHFKPISSSSQAGVIGNYGLRLKE